MRIAAGVLLIIVAVLNLGGGMVRAGFGGAMGYGGQQLEEGSREVGSSATTDKGRETAKQTEQTGAEIKAAGGMIMVIGLVLLVLGGCEIAAGVMCFLAVNAMFILVVAGVEIVMELYLIVANGFSVWYLFGIVAGVFGIVAAQGIKAAAGAPAPKIEEPAAV